MLGKRRVRTAVVRGGSARTLAGFARNPARSRICLGKLPVLAAVSVHRAVEARVTEVTVFHAPVGFWRLVLPQVTQT